MNFGEFSTSMKLYTNFNLTTIARCMLMSALVRSYGSAEMLLFLDATILIEQSQCLHVQTISLGGGLKKVNSMDDSSLSLLLDFFPPS